MPERSARDRRGKSTMQRTSSRVKSFFRLRVAVAMLGFYRRWPPLLALRFPALNNRTAKILPPAICAVLPALLISQSKIMLTWPRRPLTFAKCCVKDTGLIVELKRIAIKEATDAGQIVQDSMLTDDAVFSRLERDVPFRSLATRLLQRYGYLLPKFNPDSELGKQRELLLKERARRQLQVEAQEDAEIDAEAKLQADLKFADDCGDGQSNDCAESNSRRQRRSRSSPNTQPPPADQGAPSAPQPPADLSSPVLRTRTSATPDLGRADQDGAGYTSRLSSSGSSRDSQPFGIQDDSGGDSRASRIAQMMSGSGGSGLGAGDLGLPLSLDTNGGAGLRADSSRNDTPQGNSSRNESRARWSRELRRNAPLDFPQ